MMIYRKIANLVEHCISAPHTINLCGRQFCIAFYEKNKTKESGIGWI
ncbi:hypothetical protein T06_13821 [Trichinella sp. T6]|nr:hypothetical protein T06_13821 [Trichinella sp. T6]